MEFKQWNTFEPGNWKHEIDVRDFVQKNYTPYTGNSDFLTTSTEKTKKLWNKVLELYKKEKESNRRSIRNRHQNNIDNNISQRWVHRQRIRRNSRTTN